MCSVLECPAEIGFFQDLALSCDPPPVQAGATETLKQHLLERKSKFSGRSTYSYNLTPGKHTCEIAMELTFPLRKQRIGASNAFF